MYKKYLYLIIFVVLSFSSTINASPQTEKAKALDDIFGEKTEHETFIDKAITEYGARYVKIIRSTLGDQNKPIGQICRLSITISDKGKIESIKPINKSKLCNESINKIKKIKYFPMPKNKEANEALRRIHLTIQP